MGQVLGPSASMSVGPSVSQSVRVTFFIKKFHRHPAIGIRDPSDHPSILLSGNNGKKKKKLQISMPVWRVNSFD